MPAPEVKERLAGDVALWRADGIIDAATLSTLEQRYDTPGFGALTAVKYLGVSGAVLAGLGLLGLVAELSGSELVASVILLLASGALAWAGLRLARDPRARYVHSAKVVLALGVFGWAAAAAVAADGLGLRDELTVFLVGLWVVPATLVLAYREQNGLLLLLGVVALLHWTGAWTEMVGHSSYAIGVDDPRVIAPLAVALLLVGLWHEARGRPARFHLVYQTVALVYLDLALLILSIDAPAHALVWIAVLTLAALGEILLGARLKSPLIMGFGVTTLAVDLFTRYFENLWNHLDRGLFFVVGGVLLVGFAASFERAFRVWGPRGAR